MIFPSNARRLECRVDRDQEIAIKAATLAGEQAGHGDADDLANP